MADNTSREHFSGDIYIHIHCFFLSGVGASRFLCFLHNKCQSQTTTNQQVVNVDPDHGTISGAKQDVLRK